MYGLGMSIKVLNEDNNEKTMNTQKLMVVEVL